MKKIILAVIAIFLTTGAFAQNLEYGVKAGLNLASGTKLDDAKFRTGIHVGGFAEYVINDYVGVQAELLYSMQGVKSDDAVVDGTLKLDYINLPIFAKVYVFKGLSVDVGPQFGYMVSAKLKYFNEPILDQAPSGTRETRNIYDDEWLKKFDVSVALGLSYKLPFGLEVSARYNLGLTEIYKISDSKHSVLQFGVGYRF